MILRKIGFTGGNINPLFKMKKDEKGEVNLVLYIDESLLNRNLEAIHVTVELLQTNGLVLKACHVRLIFLTIT